MKNKIKLSLLLRLQQYFQGLPDGKLDLSFGLAAGADNLAVLEEQQRRLRIRELQDCPWELFRLVFNIRNLSSERIKIELDSQVCGSDYVLDLEFNIFYHKHTLTLL